MLKRLAALLAPLVAAALVVPAGPAAAQFQSAGFKFIKAVRDRDGNVATRLLDEPGTTVVNARDLTTGETALHAVVQRRDLTWVRFLLQRGANPNIADRNGITPLMIAARLSFVEGVERLLEGGAQVDVANATGETPLIGAVHRRDAGLVEMLVANGANPDRTDNSGRSARDYAALMGSGNPILAAIDKAEKGKGGPAPVYGPK